MGATIGTPIVEDCLAYGLYDHNGTVIDGEQYYCYLFVTETPPYSQNPPPPPPEDGEEYFYFTVVYLHFLRPPGRRQSMNLFSQQRVFERRVFYSDTKVIVSDMFSEIPWTLPEELMVPTVKWLNVTAFAAVFTDEPEFSDAFRTAKVLSLQLVIGGPYRPGGDDFVEEDYTDDEYEPAIGAQLVPLNIDGGYDDDSSGCDMEDDVELRCAICLDDLERDAIRTRCWHVFHRDCMFRWLKSCNSCPCCRARVVLLPDISK